MSRLSPGWSVARLSDVAVINPANPNRLPEADEAVSFVPMASVQEMTGRLDPRRSRTWADVRKGYTRFEDGDVLFAKITPCMENGKVALATGLRGGVGAGSTEFHVLRPSTAIDARYLMYYLLQEGVRKSARASMTGTAGQLRVPGRFLIEHSLALAPHPEQRRIVAALESHLSRLEAAAAALARAQANLKRYRSAVLQAAVTGRLVPTEAELARAEGRDYEPASELLARILVERRRRWEEAELAKMTAAGRPPKDDRWQAQYVEPVGPEVEGLGELPEGWCWATVDQLAGSEPQSLTDGPFGSELKTAHYTDSGPRVVRLQNIGDGEFLDARAHISPDHFKRLAKHALDPGDLVVASLGSEIPRVCVVPDWLGLAIVKADCIRFAPDEQLADRRYIMHALNSSPTRKRAEVLIHGVGRPRIGLSLLRHVALPLPPISEQRRTVQEVDRQLSILTEVGLQLEHHLTHLTRLRQSILRIAFEGRLVDQDPTDEPAEVLLERIRAERAAGEPAKGRRGRRAGVRQERLL